MARTNIDIDEELVNEAMRRYDPKITTDELLSLEGIGWEGDLEQMRDDNPERA
ncbi:type II toxin-antitoxin system VapB family antitoxin [Crossiella sp. NPDC003009]